MLDTSLKTQLSSYLQNLKFPIELVLSLDASDKSKELATLAKEISELSALVSMKEEQLERAPAMQVRSTVNKSVITFAGIPTGHEFTSLVMALLHTGGHPIKLEPEIIEQIKQLPGHYNFETYISLSCQNCPDVVQALNMMAAINPNITHTMIDGALFQQEVDERKIMAVPSVYLNGALLSQGRQTIADILSKVDSGADEKTTQRLNDKEPYDLLVVGGGPAGASAAIYAARKGIKTGLVADRFGGQVSDTLAIENFISVKATQGPKLVAGLEEHVKEYDVDVITGQMAKRIDKQQLLNVELESGATLSAKSIVLATGARWREMNVPGEQEYRGKGVAYCPHCDGPLFKGKKVAVIGGGNSGIEAAIDLAGIVEQVTVLEFDSKLRADEVLQRKANSLGNINIILNAQTTEVVGDSNKVTGLTYVDRTSSAEHEVELAGIFVQIGLMPNSEFLDGIIDLTARGEIIVNDKGETSIPGVFAAGDVTTSPYKQIIIAMGSGATASLSAFDYLIRQEDDITLPQEHAA